LTDNMLELIGDIPVWTAVGALGAVLVAWIIRHRGAVLTP
jgi:hypothetical protein